MTDSALLETYPVSRRARIDPSWEPEVPVISGPRVDAAVRAWKKRNPKAKIGAIARFVGISERQVLNWRNEPRPQIGGNALLRLAHILGVTVEDLTEPE